MIRVRSLSWREMAGCMAILLILSSPATAQFDLFGTSRNSTKVLAAFREVVAKPSDSTVRIVCDGVDSALGAIVDGKGLIVTKASELSGKIVCKLKDGRVFPAKIVGVKDDYDIALLEIQATDLRPIVWAASKTAEVGNWLASPGHGREPVAIGVVSVAERKPSAREMPPASAGTTGGYLGIYLQPGDDGLPTIREVTRGSPAAKAGLQAGDVVLAVSGKAVASTEKLISTIQTYRPGQSVRIKVRREEDEMVFSARLERRPVDLLNRGDRMNTMGSELSHRKGGFPVILQHDTILRPSDCGGPIVDLDGKVVGINIARAGRTESYAIPSDVVRDLLPALRSGKLAPRDETPEKISDLEDQLKKMRGRRAQMQTQLKAIGESDEELETKKELEKRLLALEKQIASSENELIRLRKNGMK